MSIDELIDYCEQEGCHDGNLDDMPSCEDLKCCEDCYIHHYYLEDAHGEHFTCNCKCHDKIEGM